MVKNTPLMLQSNPLTPIIQINNGTAIFFSHRAEVSLNTALEMKWFHWQGHRTCQVRPL